MKNTVKRLLAGLLALTLVLGLCACGGPRTPAEVMKKAGENLAKAKSMTFDMTLEMSMSAGSEAVDMTISMDGETTTEPVVVHADMTIDLGALGAMEMELYAEQNDTTVTSYISAMGVWMKEEEALDEATAALDAKGDMGSSLALASGLEEIGTETVDGVEATRYDGVITKENLQEVLKNTGVLDDLGDAMDLKKRLEDAAENTAELGDIPISIWIDKKAMLPVQYEMDMTEMMQKLIARTGEGTESLGGLLTINKVRVSMTVSDLDSVGEIVIPDEAKNAQPIS